MATTFDQVKEVIVDLIGVPEEKVVPNADLENDLNIDDVDRMEILWEIEERFSTETKWCGIGDEDWLKMKTITDYVTWLESNGFGPKVVGEDLLQNSG